MFPRPRVVEALRETVEEWRAAVRSGDGREGAEEGEAALWRRAEGRLRAQEAPSLRTAINATGVVLHTNLGRAPLAAGAQEALRAAAGYVDVEFDRASGRRARRGRGTLAALAAAVPAAEAVLADAVR